MTLEQWGPAETWSVIQSEITQGAPEVDSDYLMAVSMHETGKFTSTVFKQNNNLFGMRHPKERETTSLGDLNNDGYANYRSLRDSATDFVLWLEARDLPMVYNSVTELVDAMKANNYFEASLTSYKNAVNKHYKTIKSQWTGI